MNSFSNIRLYIHSILLECWVGRYWYLLGCKASAISNLGCGQKHLRSTDTDQSNQNSGSGSQQPAIFHIKNFIWRLWGLAAVIYYLLQHAWSLAEKVTRDESLLWGAYNWIFNKGKQQALGKGDGGKCQGRKYAMCTQLISRVANAAWNRRVLNFRSERRKGVGLTPMIRGKWFQPLGPAKRRPLQKGYACVLLPINLPLALPNLCMCCNPSPTQRQCHIQDMKWNRTTSTDTNPWFGLID